MLPADDFPSTMDDDNTMELEQVMRERDLYRKLLDLGIKDEIEPFIEEALALITEIAGARCGYLELHDGLAADSAPCIGISRGCSEDEVAAMRAACSQGIIAEALATGKTVVVASALQDPRFQKRGSVRKNRIEAVLCAPIGSDPPVGVLYLQDRQQRGPFTEGDRLRAETFARHLLPFVDRLLIRRKSRDNVDPTRPFRRTLRLDGIIGRSTALANVLKHLSLVAPLDVGVLLTGPSGTGKTHLARVIHDNGPRATQPFVELNCAALPESLLESELFGAYPGAHSTAVRRVEGKIDAAEGGTLFLDEISQLPLAAQAKLLQLLQSKEYYPLGASRPVRANVRVIAATNTDLKTAVGRHEFRGDLYYRLQVLPIRIPSLAERREDIPELSIYFCARAVEIHRLPEIRLSVGAIRAVQTTEWPGNVRELAHAIEAAVIRAAGDSVLEVERRHVFADIHDDEQTAPVTFQQATRRFQEQLLRKTLDETRWNITETAARLDLARSHVYNLIHAFGLSRQKGMKDE